MLANNPGPINGPRTGYKDPSAAPNTTTRDDIGLAFQKVLSTARDNAPGARLLRPSLP